MPHHAAAALALHQAKPPQQCRGCHYGKAQSTAALEALMCDCPVSFNFDELVDPSDHCRHWEPRT